MKSVVTGGSGFIGSFIALELAEDPETEVVLFDITKPEFDMPKNMSFFEGDTRYANEVDRAIKGAEEVYDVAGVLGTSELMMTNQRAVSTNISGAINVLDSCRKFDVKRVFHPTKPNDWLNTYSITKFAAEQFCLMYQKNYGMNISVLKWFNAYGPRQHLFPIRKMIPLFIVQALHNKPLTVFGDGSQTVDMIYVEDIAKIAIEATRKFGKIGKVLDVGSGIPMTVKEAAEMTIKMLGSQSEIEFKPMRPGEPEHSDICADVEKLRDHIKLEFTSLEEGMKPTIEYYKNLGENVHRRCFEYFGIK